MLFTNLNLDSNERIVHEVRRHWIVFIWYVVFSAVLLFGPALFYVGGLSFLPKSTAQIILNYSPILLFFYSLWALLVWTMFFVKWTNYYLDVWYITNKRIIDIEQKGIFHREVSNLRFDKIQDITVEAKGLSATFFRFGDLRIQTAGENSRNFKMVDAYHPEEVRRIIFEMHNKEAEKFDVREGQI